MSELINPFSGDVICSNWIAAHANEFWTETVTTADSNLFVIDMTNLDRTDLDGDYAGYHCHDDICQHVADVFDLSAAFNCAAHERAIAKTECISSAEMLTNDTMEAYQYLIDAAMSGETGDAAIAGRRCRGEECDYDYLCDGKKVIIADLIHLGWDLDDPDKGEDCLVLDWDKWDDPGANTLHIDTDECDDGNEDDIICRAKCVTSWPSVKKSIKSRPRKIRN
eukprot:204701_1